MDPIGIFRFGEFRVDALARTLRRREQTVSISARAFDVLLFLVQNPGRLVTREELLKKVWADTFVDENNLAQSISALRRALAEKPGDNSYIVTVPGRGYQFVSQVRTIAQENLSLVPEGAIVSDGLNPVVLERQTIRTSVITERKEQLQFRGSRNRTVLTLVVLALISILGFYSWRQFHNSQPQVGPPLNSSIAAAPAARRSVAVLGFRNLSGRPEEAWLSTALAEMLSTELVAGEKLRLVSGEDIARTKLDLPLADADSLSRDTLARLHKNLDSDLIVLGSYTALGEKPDTRIRLDLRLQDTAAGDTIADIAVMGSEANLFDLASQAGSQLREKLGVETVSTIEAVSIRASLPANRDAARLYSEGLARLRVFDALAARDLLQRLIAVDPKFALAHSALAEAWSRLGYEKKAQQEASQAYQLDTNLSREEKLVVEGRYREIDHEYDKAIDIYRTLFTLFPDNLDYGLALAGAQDRGNKGHDALATVESLRKLSPPASDDPRIDLQEVDAWDTLNDFKRQEQPQARAVEKARALGARLILARALERQCRLFAFFGQTENAIAAGRESGDIYAAAGNHAGEAGALRVWADAISETDAPESIRLYQKALTIFRNNGSEAGMASVLNNLGLIYEAQGDLATAEKMHRQALASFQVLDDTARAAVATGNIADERLEQGDLQGAIKLYEQATDLNRDNPGYVALARYNIALVYQLQGDIPGAKQGFEQSLAVWQKNGNQDFSAYGMWSLGNLLLQQADFTSARKMYEQSLALRTSANDKLTMADTQLGLADLSLEEKHSPVERTAAEQEAVIRQALEVFQKQKASDDETRAWCILARALIVENKLPAAEEAMQHARSLSAKSQNPEIRWQTAIDAARIDTAQKNIAHSAAGFGTSKELATIIAKSHEKGYLGIELEARLALAEIELKMEQNPAGRAHLIAIEADAKAKGYNLIAQKAAIARS
jgi:eukaryotic-like serine/threonine-protein kinase